MSLPSLTGTGRLVTEPDLQFTPSGKAVATVRLAFNSRRQDAGGQWTDGDTFFIRGTAWEHLAKNIADTLRKGMEVLVSGELRTESWEKDGQKREAPVLLIRTIGPSLAHAVAQVSESRQNASGSGGDAQQPQAPQNDPWAARP